MNKSSKIATLLALTTVPSFMLADKEITPLKTAHKATDAGTKNEVRPLKEKYIDAPFVMMNSARGKDAQDAVRAKQEDAFKRVEKSKEKIVKKETDFKNQASTLSADAQTAKRREIAKDEQAHQAFMQDLQEELQAEIIKITAELDQELLAAAEQLAIQEGLDVVKDKTTGRALYTSAAADKSDEIAKIIDTNYKKKLASNNKAKPASAKAA